MKNYLSLIFLAMLVSLSSCSDGFDSRTIPRTEDGTDPQVKKQKDQLAKDSFIVRGRWVVPVSSISESQNMKFSQQETVPVTSKVNAFVKFNVDISGFAVPTDIISGDVSFGEFSIDLLRDNKLRVCGAAGDERCTEAAIRVYTQGTPEAGLWHALDAYGAPISTDGEDVGLDSTGAAMVGLFTLPARKRVLRLKDFTGTDDPLEIPVDVNFDDAGAGDYATEMVIEYILR